MSKELFDAMTQSIIEGEPETAEELAKQAIQQGVAPLDAINKGCIKTRSALLRPGEENRPGSRE